MQAPGRGGLYSQNTKKYGRNDALVPHLRQTVVVLVQQLKIGDPQVDFSRSMSCVKSSSMSCGRSPEITRFSPSQGREPR